MRLRQYFANRYSSAQATQAEFENVIRYLNSAERGNHTLSELMAKLFDENGNVDVGVEMRFSAGVGIEARIVGSEADDWEVVVTHDQLRGADGLNIGTVESPIMYNRIDYDATAGQVEFEYFIDEGAVDVLVFVNGLLQPKASASFSQATGKVTLVSPLAGGEKVTIYTIRDNASATYRRTDFVAGDNQSVFPFPHEELEEVVIYKNGILQREGASYDYIKSHISGTLTMTAAQSAGTLVSAIVVNNRALTRVLGLMTEAAYTQNGFIRFDKVAIADDEIPTQKVAGLAAALQAKVDTYFGPTEPEGAINAPSLWVNTSGSVPALYFYDGVRWLTSSPDGMVPLPKAVNALQYLRLNSTGNALEFANIDFSSLVGVDDVGVPNGVASLDSVGKLASSHLPSRAVRSNLAGAISGAVADGTVPIGVYGGDKRNLVDITLVLAAGTATVQLKVGADNVGDTVAVTTAAQRVALPVTAVDASATPVPVSLVVTGAAGATGLSYSVGSTITG